MTDVQERPQAAPRRPANTQEFPEHPDYGDDVIWVVSNRRDDRVVLAEPDHRHPGGWAFIGGGTPNPVFKTARVLAAIHNGEAVEVAEPPASRKRPTPVTDSAIPAFAAMPGQPVPLGRQHDPELVPNPPKVQERDVPSTAEFSPGRPPGTPPELKSGEKLPTPAEQADAARKQQAQAQATKEPEAKGTGAPNKPA